MENLIEIEGGDILASLEDRTITGRLIPYGEEGRTNLGRFMVEAGSIDLSEALADPSIISLNIDHEPHNNVGRARRVWEQPDGVYATWDIARTPTGDAALADATNPQGKRRRLSGEFGPAVIRAGKLVAGHAKLWGSAIVPRGAFDGAMILATDTPEAAPASATQEGESTVTTTETPGTTTPAPAAATPEPAQVLAAPATTIPPTVATPSQAEATTTPAGRVAQRPASLDQVLAAIFDLKQNRHDSEKAHVLAALTDITVSGSNALPADGVLQDTWLGQLYQGIPYVREYIGLGTLGTNISLGGKKGYKVHRGTSGSPIASPAGIPQGGSWPGNKSEINSYNGWTETAVSFRRNFAVGQGPTRELFDLPGGTEVLAAFMSQVLEDHLFWSDNWALYDILTSAGAPVAAKDYGTLYGATYPDAVGQLIQGILAVKARKADKRRDEPTFALANDEAFEALCYASGGEQNLPAYVSLAISTASRGRVDGNVEVVWGETGIKGSESVLVGASRGIEFDELAGQPVRVNAVDLAKGGIDEAIHGYLQTFPVRTEAFVRIGTPPNRANSTEYTRGDLFKVSAVVYQVTGVTTSGQENNPVATGTSHSSAPTAPAVGSTVADGTLVLTRLV